MIELRPYQADDYKKLRNAFRDYRRVCFQAPTGSGKTVIFSYIAASAQNKGNPTIVGVHRRELIKQTLNKFAFAGVSAGVIASGWEAQPDKLVQIASIPTLVRRLDTAPKARLLIIDECHHVASPTWSRVLDHYKGAYVLGCTATPERLDGKGLADHFETLICGPSIGELIEQGYLADMRIFTAPVPDLSNVKRVAGDYAKAQLAKTMSANKIVGNAVEHYRWHANGLPAIAFCCTVNHAQLVAEQFRRAGYKAASVDGSMSSDKRDGVINGLSTGKLQVVTSCDLISEGLDIPDVAVAILLRPTQSLTLYLQQVGRALRPKPIPAIILDHAGNVNRHGSPATNRLWDLEGRPKRLAAERAERKARQAEFKQRKMHREIEARLVEMGEHNINAITLATLPLRDALKLCPTVEDLNRLAKLRGYDYRWVQHVMTARRRKAINYGVANRMKKAV